MSELQHVSEPLAAVLAEIDRQRLIHEAQKATMPQPSVTTAVVTGEALARP